MVVGVPMLTAALERSLSPVLENRSVCGPVPVIARLVKVATPFTVVTLVVPLSVPPPDAIAAVMVLGVVTRALA